MAEPDYKNILLELCASLTQVDHMGAAWENVRTALKLAGVNIDDNIESTQLASILAKMGVSTLDGTILSTGDEYRYD